MDQMQGGVAGTLAGTRPWVRLVSVLGFLGAAFIMTSASDWQPVA